jgi:hypothetical protein
MPRQQRGIFYAACTLFLIFMLLHTNHPLLRRIAYRLLRFAAKKSSKKIVVIESDDWGLERAKTHAAVDYAINKYGAAQQTRWTTDLLETIEDIDALGNVLLTFKGRFLKDPVITANFITHNIGYENNKQLELVPITQLPAALLQKYQSAIAAGWLHPELHGYCHYHLHELNQYFLSKDGQQDFAQGFLLAKPNVRPFLHLLRGEFAASNTSIGNNLASSIKVMETLFGQGPGTLIPPHFVFDKTWFPLLQSLGIGSLQAANRSVNSKGQLMIAADFALHQQVMLAARNCRLDPHPDYNFNADHCIANIERAFANQQPAVVDCHRVNFSGDYASQQRARTLEELTKVLNYLQQHHPDTLFLNSAALKEHLWPTQTK